MMNLRLYLTQTKMMVAIFNVSETDCQFELWYLNFKLQYLYKLLRGEECVPDNILHF